MRNFKAYKLYILLAGIFCLVHLQAIQPLFGASKLTQLEDSIARLESAYDFNITRGDTLNAIQNLSDLGTIYSHRAQYARSYEYSWNALLLADALKDSVSLAEIYNGIGWLYSFYNRTEKAIDFYNRSLSIRKKLVDQKILHPKWLISSYHNLAGFHREHDNLEVCKQYIDSCFSVHYAINENLDNSYIRAELAYYYINTNKFKEGIKILEEVEPWFKNKQPPFLIILYKYLGDGYFGDNQPQKSEFYYKQAISIADDNLNHANYIPLIHQRLSDLYYSLNKYEEAYDHLLQARKHEKYYFDSRSENNRPLLEISDDFNKEKELRKQLIQEKRLAQLEHDERVSFYKNIILSGTVIFLFISMVFIIRFFRMKNKTERELLLKKQELEQKKKNELIELKNKELASSALRLIEKDKLLKDLKDTLYDKRSKANIEDVKKIIKKGSLNSHQNWEEFEARFIEVNKVFYKNIKAAYPTLTAGDLKLCALIKLNFNSKEMANLLGVGVESIHTLRYRLRKKMNLTRADNLFEHLFQFDEN